jgi:hypothetical protein
MPTPEDERRAIYDWVLQQQRESAYRHREREANQITSQRLLQGQQELKQAFEMRVGAVEMRVSGVEARVTLHDQDIRQMRSSHPSSIPPSNNRRYELEDLGLSANKSGSVKWEQIQQALSDKLVEMDEEIQKLKDETLQARSLEQGAKDALIKREAQDMHQQKKHLYLLALVGAGCTLATWIFSHLPVGY